MIGVNTAMFSTTGTWTGVGFAIPIDVVARIVPQLIQHGRVLQPSLNIQVQPAASGMIAGLMLLPWLPWSEQQSC